MVFQDLSEIKNSQVTLDAPPVRVAFVADRLIAFLIDFLVFSPLITLAISGFLKKIRTVLIIEMDSSEAALIWGILVFTAVVFAVLLEAIFLFFRGATPGQMFLGLRVISWPHAGPLKFSQALQRSLYWWLSWFAGGWPLLEIFTHPLRRAFPDRASDTLLVTLKPEADSGPLFFEARFFSMWIWFFASAIFTVAFLSVLKMSHLVESGYLTRAQFAEAGRLCEALPPEAEGAKRLDWALSLFLAEEVDKECLEKEADYAFWQGEKSELGLAYVAKSLVASSGDAPLYREKACDLDEKSPACSLALFLASEDPRRADGLRRQGLSTLASRVLLLKEVVKDGQFGSVSGLLKDLRQEEGFERFLERQHLRAAWRVRDLLQSKGRHPAAEELRKFLDDFEERNGLEP